MTSNDDQPGEKTEPPRATDRLQQATKSSASSLSEFAERSIQMSALGRAATASEKLRLDVERMIDPYRGLDWEPVFEKIQRIGLTYQQFAKSPEIVRIGAALEKLHDSPLMAAAQNVGLFAVNLQSRLAEFNPVLLEIAKAEHAIAGLVKLQTIGDLVRQPDSYSPGMVEAMRDELGDWRDPVQFSVDQAVLSREETYRDHGFDDELVEGEDESFVEIVDTTGIRQPAMILEDIFGTFAPVPLIGKLPDGDLSRQAYNWLFVLECGIRRLIAHVMEETFGPGWPRHRLPNGMYDTWLDKQQKAVKAGRRKDPLIDYADFTDYQKIIERRDNWNEVFSALWHRQEDVRESLQRLYWVRIETMHSRALLRQDILTVYIEGQRLLQSARKIWPGSFEG